jgi:outer membrane protein TolC
VKYYEQVKLAAEAATELADLMVKAGNFNKLSQMREQVFHADATGQLARAKLAAVVERERLSRLLGLGAADLRYQLPERLPSLPDSTIAPADAELGALDRRLDVLLARRSTEAMAANLGLSKVTRFINVLEVGYTNESNTGEKRQSGYEIDIEIPLFDWGDARLARAEATYMQSVHRLQNIALSAQSEVRESYHTYRVAHDLARHYRDEVVPLRKRIADENVLRYNGMLIGVFELLADARDQIASVSAYIEALRDFWIAETNLQMAYSVELTTRCLAARYRRRNARRQRKRYWGALIFVCRCGSAPNQVAISLLLGSAGHNHLRHSSRFRAVLPEKLVVRPSRTSQSQTIELRFA